MASFWSTSRSTPGRATGAMPDHERDVRIVGGDVRDVDATLAVAEDADAGRVDLMPAAQPGERGGTVGREVGDGRGCRSRPVELAVPRSS